MSNYPESNIGLKVEAMRLAVDVKNSQEHPIPSLANIYREIYRCLSGDIDKDSKKHKKTQNSS